MPAASEIIARAGENLPPERARLIEEAYVFATDAHEGQNRKTGEPYIVHPIDAAMTVASLNLDGAAIAAALLHDVVEDCGVANEEISEKFGPDVARLVEGVTKLNRINLLRPEDVAWDEGVQADNLRKMFLAMAEDIRVVVIKLADRLHNMRTLEGLEPEKQVRVARETMEIYAPLAHRLGLGQIAHELEDYAFQYLEPDAYSAHLQPAHRQHGEPRALRGPGREDAALRVGAQRRQGRALGSCQARLQHPPEDGKVRGHGQVVQRHLRPARHPRPCR